MNYILDYYNRSNIQQLRAFILYGVEDRQISQKTYEQRVEDGIDRALSNMRQHFPYEYEQMEEAIRVATKATRDAYTEIGIKLGMRIAAQLMDFNH